METNNLVSIIIPCYNQAEYLEEAVNSAIDQTYNNIEIIIINDGSTDNTKEIAKNMQAKYPGKIQVILQENSGVSKARNNAIRQSRGQYILPLDADDTIDEKMISQCVNAMIENSADIVYANVQCFGVKKFLIKKKPFSENNILYENLPHNISLYRKKVWEETNGYQKNMNEGYEDWEFWINAYKHKFVFFRLPETLIYYRTEFISRDTIAFKEHHALLISKIVMNHPELYTIDQVHNATRSIQETESLANLYFYSAQDLSIDEKYLVKTIGDYLASNALQEKQFIAISDTTKQVGLFALDKVANRKELTQLYQEAEADYILFYAPLRYEVPSLKNLDFAWGRDKGIVRSSGSLFPFVFKSKREDNKLQLIAYQKELKYLKYKSNMDNEAAKKKLDSLQNKYNIDMDNARKKFDSLQHKYNIDTEISQEKLDTITNNYNLMMRSISNLIGISAKTKPLQKISAYKSLAKDYFELQGQKMKKNKF